MTNAVQAMSNEGKLTINAFRKKDKTVITIQDTGVGIPEHVKTKMFTPLVITKSKGQGLGLAVVKRLVEALKGTIIFESEENKGTKFTLEFSTNDAWNWANMLMGSKNANTDLPSIVSAMIRYLDPNRLQIGSWIPALYRFQYRTSLGSKYDCAQFGKSPLFLMHPAKFSS